MSDGLDEASPEKAVLVVGHRGRMGRMLMVKGRAAGYRMIGIDLPFDKSELVPACREAWLALLCVPAKNLEETAEKIIPWLADTAILSDITSVKEAPMRQMEKLWPGAVVGTHPLFGPGAREEDDRPVVIVPGQKAGEQDIELVEAFFRVQGCRVFRSSAEEHDRAMSHIQNMNFITNLAYFAVTANHDELLPYLTPSFQRRKQAAAKMLTEDAEMFAGLFEANSHSHEAVRQFRKMLNLAASGDIELLCRKAQWWWQDAEMSGEMESKCPQSP